MRPSRHSSGVPSIMRVPEAQKGVSGAMLGFLRCAGSPRRASSASSVRSIADPMRPAIVETSCRSSGSSSGRCDACGRIEAEDADPSPRAHELARRAREPWATCRFRASGPLGGSTSIQSATPTSLSSAEGCRRRRRRSRDASGRGPREQDGDPAFEHLLQRAASPAARSAKRVAAALKLERLDRVEARRATLAAAQRCRPDRGCGS